MAYLRVITREPVHGCLEIVGIGLACIEKNAVKVSLSEEISVLIPWSNILSVESVQDTKRLPHNGSRDRTKEEMERLLLQSARLYGKEQGFCLAQK